jgi:hypothetical protein
VIDIIIPSNHNLLDSFINEVITTAGSGFNVIQTGFDVSAATNRNYGLNKARSSIVIMIDDDISGFGNDWASGLVKSLVHNEAIMVSARLMDAYGQPGTMMSIPVDFSKPIVESPCHALPSSCICFYRDDTRFDENYKGAGFEDTDFCFQLHCKYPNKKFLINNDVRVVHRNEKKNYLKNGNNNYIDNQHYFERKWNLNFNEMRAQ